MTHYPDLLQLPDPCYILNYDGTTPHDRTILRIASILDGILMFTQVMYIEDGKVVRKLLTPKEYDAHDIISYADQYSNEDNDMHFLLNDDEVLKHVMMEEI